MGSEDLFHKRKARESADLQRVSSEREKNKRYLIVCEGTKTEPQYFAELLQDLRIPKDWVRIAPNDGSSPDRIVKHALQLYADDAASGDPYDAVYCVFDRDDHPTFDEAVQRTKRLKNARKPKPLIAITSIPCFEVWLLLHFGYTTQPFHAAGKKSVGDQVVAKLKKVQGFKNYAKGQKGVYKQLKDKLQTALQSAEKLRQHCAATNSSNPATDIDDLVSILQGLRR